eukprot:sb/3467438/
MLFISAWGVTLCLYIFSPLVTPSMRPETWPLIFFVLVFLLLFFPAPVFYYRTRFWLLRRLRENLGQSIGLTVPNVVNLNLHIPTCLHPQFRILTTPVFPVEFADFFIADQLNSLATVLLDISFVACYYTTSWGEGADQCSKGSQWYRIFIALLPPWFRFAQSIRRYCTSGDWFPHAVNAGKYFSSMLVVVLSASAGYVADKNGTDLLGLDIFTVYVFFACVSTLYAYWWDIKMDWGFLDHTSTDHKNKYLRDELLRSVWNFFRLENEHLNNCGQFRAVRDINVRVITETEKKQKEQ